MTYADKTADMITSHYMRCIDGYWGMKLPLNLNCLKRRLGSEKTTTAIFRDFGFVVGSLKSKLPQMLTEAPKSCTLNRKCGYGKPVQWLG